jgi:hypothetical protein
MPPDPVALRAEPLGHADRRGVVRLDEQLDPLEAELVEAPGDEQARRRGGQAGAAGGRHDPVAERRAQPVLA